MQFARLANTLQKDEESAASVTEQYNLVPVAEQ